jgi:hypothetical protein
MRGLSKLHLQRPLWLRLQCLPNTTNATTNTATTATTNATTTDATTTNAATGLFRLLQRHLQSEYQGHWHVPHAIRLPETLS